MTPKPEKPPLPAIDFDVFPRITIDESEGGTFDRVLRTALFASAAWRFGPEGPNQVPGMTGAQITRGEVAEALLHLLELGVIDVDVERWEAMDWCPTGRAWTEVPPPAAAKDGS